MNCSKIASTLLLFCLLLGFAVVSAAAADLSISAGGGVWRNEGDGELRFKDNPSVDVDYLDYDDENRGYVWAELRHPVPFLPNLRLEYVDLKFSAHSDHAFAWENIIFDTDTATETKLTQVDMVLFYNVASVSWFDLDLGVDVKYIDFEFDADGSGKSFDDPSKTAEYSVHEDEDLFVPFVYGKVRFNIPESNFGIEGNARYITYKDSDALDTSIKIDYLFDVKPVKFGIELGYRYESIDIDEDDFSGLTFDIDIDIKGFFAGVVCKF